MGPRGGGIAGIVVVCGDGAGWRYARAVKPRVIKLVLGLTSAAATLGMVAFLATRGEPEVGAAMSALARLWVTGGGAGVLWCAGAMGCGMFLLRWLVPTGTVVRESGARLGWAQPVLTLERAALGAALGAGVMLWLAHGLGVLGLLSGATGIGIVWGLVVVGSLLLARALRARPPRVGGEQDSRGTLGASRWWFALACVPAVGVLVVAACVPTGTLWASEARGYDSLSYHLALPREWHAAGRLWPSEHNAYSWLPSYVEAGYLELSAMLVRADMDGRWITACNAMHATMFGLSAITIAAMARTIAMRAGMSASATRIAALAGGSVTLVVPWCVVTGSLSYNEMGMLLCLAGACLAAAMPGAAEHAGRRGAIIGFLLGIATACKPTAAFMGGPVVLLCVLAWARGGDGARRGKTLLWLLLAVFIGGVAASLPWLLRNYVACGNPVFPSMVSVFGSAHWDAGQVERWNAAHHPAAGVLGAVVRLFTVNGVLHPQWSLFFVVATVGVAGVTSRRTASVAAWPLAVGLVSQLLAWMMIGHQQARFLVPCVLTGAAVFGVSVAMGVEARSAALRRWGVLASVAIVLLMSLDTARQYMRENAGAPAMALVGGVQAITGAALGSDAMLERVEPSERARYFEESGNPVAATNRLAGLGVSHGENGGPRPLVYLLGDATPAYFSVPVLWNTVWDSWPLEAAMRERGDDPHAWAESLRARGVTHVLINFSEIERFRSSGYSPPSMTVETARRFAGQLELMVGWPRIGSALYRLR